MVEYKIDNIYLEDVSSVSIVLMDRLAGDFKFELDYVEVYDRTHVENFAYETYTLMTMSREFPDRKDANGLLVAIGDLWEKVYADLPISTAKAEMKTSYDTLKKKTDGTRLTRKLQQFKIDDLLELADLTIAHHKARAQELAAFHSTQAEDVLQKKQKLESLANSAMPFPSTQ